MFFVLYQPICRAPNGIPSSFTSPTHNAYKPHPRGLILNINPDQVLERDYLVTGVVSVNFKLSLPRKESNDVILERKERKVKVGGWGGGGESVITGLDWH